MSLLSDILSNKAAAMIKLECFNSALACTDKILVVDSSHVKAIYRHAKALLGLGRYAECQFLNEKLAQIPSLGQAHEDLVRMRSSITDLGKPPGKDIIAALRRPGPSCKAQPDLPVGMLDRISEYRGPLRLGPSNIGKGEGLFATEDLAVGTVLIVCKPFAGLYVQGEEKEEFSINTNCYKYLVGTMANKIWLDPQLGREIYTLWAGPELKSLEDDDPKIEKVDMARLEKIYFFNVTNTGFAGQCADHFISAGIWIPQSKIIHSCVDANVMIGVHESSLVMMGTTFKEVKQGEEIVSSYVPPMLPFWERDFMESHGFICKCRLCELDRSEGAYVITKRESLLKRLKFHPLKYAIRNSESRLIPNMKTIYVDLGILTELKSLRAATPDLNFAMTNPEIYKMATFFLDTGSYDSCFLILEEAYAAIRNVPPNNVKYAYAEAILVAGMKMRKEKAVLEKWVEEVRKYCRLYAGTLEHVRAGHYPTIPEDLKKFGIEFFNEETG
ncbi:uncharacterized protein LOC110854503 [Folsomia candida]|nr:uncharacterized protein LOC110854503 [Folsomia candida]